MVQMMAWHLAGVKSIRIESVNIVSGDGLLPDVKKIQPHFPDANNW